MARAERATTSVSKVRAMTRGLSLVVYNTLRGNETFTTTVMNSYFKFFSYEPVKREQIVIVVVAGGTNVAYIGVT